MVIAYLEQKTNTQLLILILSNDNIYERKSGTSVSFKQDYGENKDKKKQH